MRFLICLILFSLEFTLADDITRKPIPPFCTALANRLTDTEIQVVRKHDNEWRELLIRQALGDQRLEELRRVLGVDPFEKVQSLDDALKMVDQSMYDKNFFEPILRHLNELSPAKSWAVYLNSGYHAVSTHTEEHRDMIDSATNRLPTNHSKTSPLAVVDYGLGNANLMIANLFKDPTRHVHGIDIAGAGLNIGTLRLNEMGDQIALQYSDPGFLNHARTGIFRRNILDSQLLPLEYYDGGTMILTLFTVPLENRPQALLNAYQSLKPGAPFTIVEPISKVHDELSARQFLRDIVTSSYKNNPDLTYLDVALLAVKNAQQLLKSNTQFLSPESMQTMIRDAGFVIRKVGPAFYGATNKLDLEKPER